MVKRKEAEKTNAARLLDKAGIKYELVSYPVDEDDLSAIHLAESIGEDITLVYKTIVLSGDRTGHFVCVVRGDDEVDLKAAAKVSGNKKAELIHLKELQPLTGYIRGGCSPIGMKKPFPTYFSKSILGKEFVYVSAGRRGLQLKMDPQELISFVGGEIF